MAAVGATREDFARAGRELPGARRAVLLKPTDAAIELPCRPEGAIRLRFTLPAGAYATVFVDYLLDSR